MKKLITLTIIIGVALQISGCGAGDYAAPEMPKTRPAAPNTPPQPNKD